MQVIRWHATQERVDRQSRNSTSSTPTPLTTMPSAGPLSTSFADALVPAAAPHDHSRLPTHTESAPTAHFARRPEPPVMSLLSAPPLPVPTAPSLPAVDEPCPGSPQLPAHNPFSFLSTTSMTASLSLDDLAAREERRAAQRRRRGDVDRVLQIFDEVDAHFASLQDLAHQRASATTTTATATTTPRTTATPAPFDSPSTTST
ncbi:hypothetical protein pqer_cds_236 [Pandoravirus quercus]|uniref:Uncharacterized protein n=2 Tax=Pandoravirus TaxID=2060084 RepID=A0A2U7U886_9VIRU|nr:hypothetical protein pqer_cds_236 [Pandoravirus quercus]AVK74658.1 hypothetical protein pqer_cds_236 [Pandoravirus quercus]QBZ80836.1 hypothetical protein pclt_cds_238 [Pandoravirus celtis]